LYLWEYPFSTGIFQSRQYRYHLGEYRIQWLVGIYPEKRFVLLSLTVPKTVPIRSPWPKRGENPKKVAKMTIRALQGNLIINPPSKIPLYRIIR